MPIEDIKQRKIIYVDAALRLKAFEGEFDFALNWYQDKASLEMIDGKDSSPYDREKLERMYRFLDRAGELYFIEIKKDGAFIPIGDVTLCLADLPVVIAKDYRGKGIGKKVLLSLIKRAEELGLPSLKVKEIYRYNIVSQKLFTSCGFTQNEETEEGHSYILKLSK